MISMIDLYNNHKGKVSDKWSLYLDIYENILSEFQNKPINLLEIGVQNGGSLEIWAKYFTNLQCLIGCDIDEKCNELKFDYSTIAIVTGDINLPDTQHKKAEKADSFDIIIDDGSHVSGDIIRAFIHFFPKLKENGIYVIEDLHCSYWKGFQGGLFNRFSSMAFFKRLLDMLNEEHWNATKKKLMFLTEFFETYQAEITYEDLATIHCISFYNSLCVIRKKPIKNNTLNRRIISGTIADVNPNCFHFKNTNYERNAVLLQDTEYLENSFEKMLEYEVNQKVLLIQKIKEENDKLNQQLKEHL